MVQNDYLFVCFVFLFCFVVGFFVCLFVCFLLAALFPTRIVMEFNQLYDL